MARPKSKSKRAQLNTILKPAEYREIDGVVNMPPIPDDITKIKPAHMISQNFEDERWRNAMFWVAYLMYPNIDVTRTPYLKRDIQTQRPWGEVLYYLLPVVRECWEGDLKLRSQFKDGTPIKLWAVALTEMRAVDIRRSWHTQTGKPAEKQLWTDFYNALQSGYESYLDELNTPILDAIFHSAQRMRKAKAKRTRERFGETWTPFLHRIKDFIRSISKSSLLTPSQDGSAILMTGRRNQDHRVSIPWPTASRNEVSAMSGLKLSQRLPNGDTITYVYDFSNRETWSECYVFAYLNKP